MKKKQITVKPFKEWRKKTKIIFLSSLSFIFYLSYVGVFNLFLNSKEKIIYPILAKKTGVLFLGYFAFGDKKITINGVKVLITHLKNVKSSFLYTNIIFISLVVIFLIIKLFSKPKKKNTSQGSADWGTLKDVDIQNSKDKIFGVSLIQDEGVILGKKDGVTLRDNAPTHLCVVAPTRTGKGVSIIIPTLISGWKESTVVLDIKGENYQLTSGARKEQFDNLILRFSPKAEDSCSFNPLREIRFMTIYEVEDVRLITNIICQDENSKDPFWNTSAAQLMNGLIFYEMYKNFLKNPEYVYENGEKKPITSVCLGDITTSLTDANNVGNLNEILKAKSMENLIETYGANEKVKKEVREKLTKIYGMELEFINSGRHPVCSRELFGMGTQAEQTLGSIVGVAKTKLTVFEIPIIKQNTSTSDFRIFDLMNYEKPIALYLVIPPADILLLSPLVKIFLVQMVKLLTPELDYFSKIKHKWRMLMLLDEFPTIGKIEDLESGIGYFAGYGIKMMIILQSLDQLFKIYKKENGFLSNCQGQIFYTTNDETTSNYVSKLLGEQTIEQFTQSNKAANTFIKTQSQQFIKRNLLTPDEVGRFPSDKIIIKLSGKKPIQSDKIIYFLEDEYKHLTEIPFIATESCYNIRKKYFKLTPNLKKQMKDFPYKYFPYKEGLATMKRKLKKEYEYLIANQNTVFEFEKEKEDFRARKENFQKQNKAMKLYLKYYKLVYSYFYKDSLEEEKMLKKVEKENFVTEEIEVKNEEIKMFKNKEEKEIEKQEKDVEKKEKENEKNVKEEEVKIKSEEKEKNEEEKKDEYGLTIVEDEFSSEDY